MQNSKLIQLLKTFSVTELREFKEFLQSPFHNKNQELTAFYLYLKKITPELPPKKLLKEAIFSALYGQVQYEDKKIRYLMSFTLKLAEEYIGLKKYQQQDTLVKSHCLESLIERNLEKSYQHIFQKTTHKLAKTALRDTNYCFEKYLLAEISNKHFTTKNLRKFNDQLQLAYDNFDIYYLSQKLKYSCEMMSMQRFLSADFSQNLIEEIGRFLEKKSYQNVPTIAIYHQVFLSLIDEKEEAHFEKLVLLLDKYHEKFADDEMQGFYLHAINYCIRKMRQKDKKYELKALELYIKGIDNRLILQNGILSPWTYKNIVKLGLRLKKFEWTEQFIKKYTSILEEEFRLNAYNYGLADLFYHKQDIQEALTHLREVEFSDIFFTLDAKIMLLKIYYDNQEEEALLSLLASFNIFLKRNKLISNEVRDTYGNFITFLGRILKPNQKQWVKLKQEINDIPLLSDRTWLLQIIDKIKQKKL